MSAKNDSNTVETPKDQVGEVTDKLEQLNVDNTNEANEKRSTRRAFRGRGGFRGRGRGGRGRQFAPRIPYEEQLKKIEEEQKSKKLVESGVKGYVKWFSVRGRYGFLARDGEEKEGEDVFVHQTAIVKSNTIKIYLRTLDEKEPVVFDIVEGRKGLEAANVSGPNGENVKGSRFARQLFSRFRFAHRTRQNSRPQQVQEGEQQDKSQQENGEGETRKRRPRRARGKLAPNAQKDENGVEQNEEVQKEEKGNGDAADNSVKKADRRTKNRKKSRNGKKGDASEGQQQDQKEKPSEQEQKPPAQQEKETVKA
ncbi:unnamed protein product [Caenorhabditis bovis]|uniref:CSD domain-containing protein n=1 Tax=Caenorhabditis bovis TaxID=2654633 RepID=A0A8S1EFB5_9PELO|nr:unnamed protein product [Caenorhabditis bovis]